MSLSPFLSLNITKAGGEGSFEEGEPFALARRMFTRSDPFCLVKNVYRIHSHMLL